jgi:hypothetical protein
MAWKREIGVRLVTNSDAQLESVTLQSSSRVACVLLKEL